MTVTRIIDFLLLCSVMCVVVQAQQPVGYLGFFIDNEGDSLENGNRIYNSNENTGERCKARCREHNNKYMYAGTQDVSCYCGSDIVKEWKRNDTECDRNCPQSSSEKCGGYSIVDENGRISLYDTQPSESTIKTTVNFTVSPSTQAIQSSTLKTTVSPSTQAIQSSTLKTTVSPSTQAIQSSTLKTTVSPSTQAIQSSTLKTTVSPSTQAIRSSTLPSEESVSAIKTTVNVTISPSTQNTASSTIPIQTSVNLLAVYIAIPVIIAFQLIVLGLIIFVIRRNSVFIRRARNAVGVPTVRFSEPTHEHKSQTDNDVYDDIEELDVDDIEELEDSCGYMEFLHEPVYSALNTAEEERYYATLISERKVRRQSLEEYVTRKTGRNYLDEFQQLPSDLTKPYTESQKKENRKKNRYKGIFPYDSTLVTLHGGTSDYINASYIDGYDKCREYIATIGPTTKYMGDMSVFWRMVWHEKSGNIVMLTNIDEPQAYRCDKYWPENEYTSLFNNIRVSTKSEEQFDSYTLRTFEVQFQSEKRQVNQFHFTAWQETQLPNVMNLVEFQQKVNHYRPASDGPLIVHCSAGVGRTGTYIVLDILTHEIEADGHIDIFACVKKLREQRVNMVQTVEQYKFIHDALVCSQNLYTHLDGILSGTNRDCLETSNTYSQLVLQQDVAVSEV